MLQRILRSGFVSNRRLLNGFFLLLMVCGADRALAASYTWNTGVASSRNESNRKFCTLTLK